MAEQVLIGQVYNVEGADYKKNGEDRRRVTFRLGMAKPYKEKVDGEEKRRSTFITVKCFNGLSETIEQYFGGDENKGRWIQLRGHFEEEEFDQMQEIDHPDDDELVIELPVKIKQLVFMVSGFSFIGEAPSTERKPASTKAKDKKKPVFKKKSDKSGTKSKPSAKEAEEELADDIEDDEAPF